MTSTRKIELYSVDQLPAVFIQNVHFLLNFHVCERWIASRTSEDEIPRSITLQTRGFDGPCIHDPPIQLKRIENGELLLPACHLELEKQKQLYREEEK